MASSLSIYQQTELRDAIMSLTIATSHIDRILHCDAMDDLDEAELLSRERNSVGRSINTLKSLLNE